MKKLIGMLFLSVITFSLCHAQTDWRAELQKETVTIEDGKYKSSEYNRIKFENGNSIQIAVTASATLENMNRDNFITLYNTLSLFTIVGILNSAGYNVDDVDYEDLDEPVGTPEIALDFTMTDSGIVIAVTTEDGTEKENMSWEEFFADN